MADEIVEMGSFSEKETSTDESKVNGEKSEMSQKAPTNLFSSNTELLDCAFYSQNIFDFSSNPSAKRQEVNGSTQEFNTGKFLGSMSLAKQIKKESMKHPLNVTTGISSSTIKLPRLNIDSGEYALLPESGSPEYKYPDFGFADYLNFDREQGKSVWKHLSDHV